MKGKKQLMPKEVRSLVRSGWFDSKTANLCEGYLQANVVILDSAKAQHFRRFCELNWRSAPLLEVLPPGVFLTADIADKADVRTDVPRYLIKHSDGRSEEVTRISEQLWNSREWVSFFLGCSFSFEGALANAGIGVRHNELDVNVPMFDTAIGSHHVAGFGKHMVVSMRPVARSKVKRAIEITKAFPKSHGAALHGFGSIVLPECGGLRVPTPGEIGIADIHAPNYGDSVPIYENEIALFWPCGVSTQVAVDSALETGVIDVAITHKPGHMFICDLKADDSRLNALSKL